jgi:NAD(P)-dependent dehydrogenase (short-subunit alcohol dehydrogenase family)
MTEVLRRGLLEGLIVAFSGDAPAVAAACAELGASTPAVHPDQPPVPDTLVCATAPAFVGAGGGLDGLRVAEEAAFVATSAVANAWIAADRGGKVVLLAPPAGTDGAGPLRAALENLARTLSIEWARYDIRITAVLPGADEEAVATLVAFLASPAGDYYSGCAFTLADG